MNYVINTPCGKIKGIQIDNEDIIAYKGVRYAYAKRFEYPIQVTSWQGVYDASKYGNCSYQPRAFYNEEENPGKIFYYNESRKKIKIPLLFQLLLFYYKILKLASTHYFKYYKLDVYKLKN